MKRKLSLIAVSLLLVSGTTFARTAPIAITQPNFAPVSWHASMTNGGFALQNQTSKTQYIQVNIEKGQISVFTVSGGALGKCKQDLNAHKGPFTVVCEVAPNDILEADVDFSKPKLADATGTYQIKMDKQS